MNAKNIAIAFAALGLFVGSNAAFADTIQITGPARCVSESAPIAISQPAVLEKKACATVAPTCYRRKGLLSTLFHPKEWFVANLFGAGVEVGSKTGFTAPLTLNQERMMVQAAVLPGAVTGETYCKGNVITQSAVLTESPAIRPIPYQISPAPMLDFGMFGKRFLGFGYIVPRDEDARF